MGGWNGVEHQTATSDLNRACLRWDANTPNKQISDEHARSWRAKDYAFFGYGHVCQTPTPLSEDCWLLLLDILWAMIPDYVFFFSTPLVDYMILSSTSPLSSMRWRPLLSCGHLDRTDFCINGCGMQSCSEEQIEKGSQVST